MFIFSLRKYIKSKKESRKEKLLKIRFFYDSAKSYLKNGLYYIDIKRNIIYKSSQKSKYKAIKSNVFLNIKKNKKIRFVYRIIDSFYNRRHIFKINNKKCCFSGTLAILGSINKDMKIFNFRTKKVLSVFSDFERAQSIIDRRSKMELCGYEITRSEKVIMNDKTCLIEPLISIKPYNHNSIFPKIIEQYVSIQKKLKPEPLRISKNEKENILFIAKQLSDNSSIRLLEKIESKNNICYFCHGDFHYFNYIFDGRQHYYVDFELSDYHIFFYDIFFYVFFEALRFKNLELWISLNQGKYDNYLRELFELNGIHYSRREIPAYLIITVFFFYEGNISLEALSLMRILLNQYEK